MPARRLSDRERTEWLNFAQTIGTKALRPAQARAMEEMRAVAAKSDPPVAAAEPPVSLIVRPAGRPAATWKIPEVEVGKPTGGLDGASWNRLRRGQMRPERVLDLHGRTVQLAFAAFERFVLSSRADGLRCVEIVTGRGSGDSGILRRELPHWLNLPHIRSAILAAAHPHRANTGAVVLLLRRIRA